MSVCVSVCLPALCVLIIIIFSHRLEGSAVRPPTCCARCCRRHSSSLTEGCPHSSPPAPRLPWVRDLQLLSWAFKDTGFTLNPEQAALSYGKQIIPSKTPLASTRLLRSKPEKSSSVKASASVLRSLRRQRGKLCRGTFALQCFIRLVVGSHCNFQDFQEQVESF